MPQRLVFTVEVDSGDETVDKAYLQSLQNIFRLLTEEQIRWGYSDDEVFCRSAITPAIRSKQVEWEHDA